MLLCKPHTLLRKEKMDVTGFVVFLLIFDDMNPASQIARSGVCNIFCVYINHRALKQSPKDQRVILHNMGPLNANKPLRRFIPPHLFTEAFNVCEPRIR